MNRFPMMAGEFPTFDQSTLPEVIPGEWEDASWHNNACPSFLAGMTKDGETVEVFIDFPNKADREFPGCKRFTVLTEGDVHLETDEWSEVPPFVKTLVAGSEMDHVTEEEMVVLRRLAARGFAVVVIEPSELRGAHPSKVEERLIELSWEIINDYAVEPDQEVPE